MSTASLSSTAPLPTAAPLPAAVPLSAEARRLVEEHLPLIRSVVAGVAAHYPRHADREELAQAAALGLVEAAGRYDSARAVPFGRWASLRMRGAVVDAVRALDFAPRSLRSAARDAAVTTERLQGQHGRAVTDAETAQALGMTAQELAALRGRVHQSLVLSLDAPTGSGPEGEASDVLGSSVIDVAQLEPAELLAQREQDTYLQDALECLPDRMRAVVRGYFLEGRSSADLAADLGVTESRVSQLRSAALALMRAGLEAQYAEVPPPRAAGRQATTRVGPRRAEHETAAYAAALADRSTFAGRLSESSRARPIPQRGGTRT